MRNATVASLKIRIKRRAVSAALRRSAEANKQPRRTLRNLEGSAKGASHSNRSIAENLLRWYDLNKRDLPWRRRVRDPYAQWVAEVMLQQTRVETVIPFYERFMRRFPDVESLSRARYQTVLRWWEGLGYYRRALHLHRAARILNARDAEIPRTFNGLRELPGLGDYIAAAVASIAFGEPVAAVDGNVARVMSRLFMIEGDIRNSVTVAKIRETANEVLSNSCPGDFNQALMDLGSSICTPRAPQCHCCPLAKRCAARAAERVDQFPEIIRRRAAKPVRLLAVAFLDRNRLLMRRSGMNDLWPGCWELPTRELKARDNQRKTLKEFAQAHCVDLCGEIKSVPRVVHQLTHRTLQFHPHIASVKSNDASSLAPNHRWIALPKLDKIPISTGHRKLLDAIAPEIDTTMSQGRRG